MFSSRPWVVFSVFDNVVLSDATSASRSLFVMVALASSLVGASRRIDPPTISDLDSRGKSVVSVGTLSVTPVSLEPLDGVVSFALADRLVRWGTP